jgi:hypothetical protein
MYYFLFLQTNTYTFTKLFYKNIFLLLKDMLVSIQLSSLLFMLTHSKAGIFYHNHPHPHPHPHKPSKEKILLTLNSCQCTVVHQSWAESTTQSPWIETE